MQVVAGRIGSWCARGRMLRYAVGIISAACLSVRAEKFELKGTKLPADWMLQELYAFFVYSKDETPAGNASAVVEFRNIRYRSPTRHEEPDYTGIQLSLVKYAEVLQMPINFCCTQLDVETGRCAHSDQIVFRTRLTHRQDEDQSDIYKYPVKPTLSTVSRTAAIQTPINSTGVYVLVVSNCGAKHFHDGTLYGEVVVKSAYGYLSGLDYYKMPFYGVLALVYICLTLLWSCLCLLYRKELFRIHICLGWAIVLGLLESCLWFLNYYIVNLSGNRAWVAFLAATWFSVAKTIFSYMLVLVGSMGWGITKPYLDSCTVCKISALSGIFIVLDFTRRVVLSFRHTSPVLPVSFVFGILLPISVLNGVIFYWVFNCLGRLMEELQAKKQDEKLLLFTRLWKILLFALCASTLSQFHEFFNVSRGIEERWRQHWFFADGMSHLLFMVPLIGMMLLWRPHADSQRYAFSQQIDCDDKDLEATQATGGQSPACPEFAIGDCDDDDFTIDVPNVQPTKVGASS